MRRTAGAVLVALALVALVAFAATGFGAGASPPAKAQRSGAIAAHVHFRHATAKLAGKGPSVIYGSASTTVPVGDRTVTLGKCPKKTHIVNGTLAALHGDQAPNFTIHGFGIASPKTWFVDVGNTSEATSPPGFPVKAVGFIVCKKG